MKGQIIQPGRILVVGSLNMDLVVQAPRHPTIGETILGGEFHTYPGGKGANQAVAARRLGATVQMVGRVGKDSFGTSLLQTLQQDGVDTRYVAVDVNAATGVALITVSASGQNTIVVASGANASLSSPDLFAAGEAFEQAQVLITQLETPLPVVRQALEIAQRKHVLTILNPAPAQPFVKDLLAEVDYLIPNEHEMATISGTDRIEDGIKILQGLGVKNLVITMGEKGALAVQGYETRQVPAFPIQAVDTTAAGDAFVGALAVALTQGKDIFQATRWANAAGALAASRPGAQPSLPDRKELDEFVAAQT